MLIMRQKAAGFHTKHEETNFTHTTLRLLSRFEILWWLLGCMGWETVVCVCVCVIEVVLCISKVLLRIWMTQSDFSIGLARVNHRVI